MSEPASTDIARNPESGDQYAYWRDEIVRYNDLDTLGHVTSQAFINYFESSRVLFLRDAGQPIDAGDRGWMLVRMEIDLRAQLRFPSMVRVGTRLERLGRSSIVTAQGLLHGDRCAAVLVSTLVLVSTGQMIDRSPYRQSYVAV